MKVNCNNWLLMLKTLCMDWVRHFEMFSEFKNMFSDIVEKMII